MVEAESPGASLPSSAISASSKSPVETAFEVEDRDQHVEALGSTSIGRQNRRAKANALGAFADTIAQPGAAHGD
jgi:hypothetical protein